jgi:hypothetical protein
MLTATYVDDGNGLLIYVHDAGLYEEFSVQLLERAEPFIVYREGRIIITAANGRWIYRPIGRCALTDEGYQGIRAVLVTHIVYNDTPSMYSYED